MGHGLTAVLLGGEFHRLEIYPDGSGLAIHSGELFLGRVGQALVAAAGPMGPPLAGALFILASRRHSTTRLGLVLWDPCCCCRRCSGCALSLACC